MYRNEPSEELEEMLNMAAGQTPAHFKIAEIAKSFPETADTLLLDKYLTNEQAASARVFRVYRPTPPHYHATCDGSPETFVRAV